MLMMIVDEQDEHKELVVGWPNRVVGSKILIIHILDPNQGYPYKLIYRIHNVSK